MQALRTFQEINAAGLPPWLIIIFPTALESALPQNVSLDLETYLL